MPTKTKKRGVLRWKAVKVVAGIRREKWFPDATKKSWKAAVAWEEKTGKTLIDGTPTHSASSPRKKTLGEWATDYMSYAQAKYVDKTFEEKRRSFRRFFAQIHPDLPAHRLTQGEVLRFMQAEMERRGGNQANRARKNLVAAWNWGMRYLSPPLPGPNPCLVDRMPERQKERYVPPESDFWKVVDAAETEQNRVMILTALHTAARRGEIFRLKRTDIDFDGRQIRLWTRKRRDGSWEYDWIPMTGELKSHLLSWMETRMTHAGTDPDHLFVNLNPAPLAAEHYGKPFKNRQRFLLRLCEKASVEPFGFHAIRHLTASILYRHGEPLEVIQRILRHKSATTTNRYLRSLGSDHVREAMDSALARPMDEVIQLKKRNE